MNYWSSLPPPPPNWYAELYLKRWLLIISSYMIAIYFLLDLYVWLTCARVHETSFGDHFISLQMFPANQKIKKKVKGKSQEWKINRIDYVKYVYFKKYELLGGFKLIQIVEKDFIHTSIVLKEWTQIRNHTRFCGHPME